MAITSWLETLRRRCAHRLGTERNRRAALPSPSKNAVELLEQRLVLSVTALFSEAAGTLTIGANDGDTIEVSSSASGNVEVRDATSVIPILGLSDDSLSADDVRALIVMGSTGSDTIDLSGANAAAFEQLTLVSVNGGAGDDTITGASDLAGSLIGGAGDDSIVGLAGNDFLDGGDGNDRLDGSAASLLPGENINVSAIPFDQVEVTIAVNPTDSQNLIAAGNNRDLDAINDLIWYSTDGGSSWTSVAIQNAAGTLSGGGDPTVVFDRNGVAYYAHLTIAAVDDFGNLKARIEVVTSTNGGASWSNPIKVPIPDIDVDKEFLAVGPDKNDLSRDRIYLAYHFDNVQYINSSIDGINWSDPVRVQDSGRGINAQPAVAANGDVYLAWQEYDDEDDANDPDPERLVFAKSVDAGLTWSADATVRTTDINTFRDPFDSGEGLDGVDEGEIDGLGKYEIPAQPDRGIYSGISIDIDRSNGPYQNRIYVVFVDQGDLDGDPDATNAADHHNTDIFLVASDDMGATWTALGATPVRINDDVSANSQFLPWLDVEQTTGNVAVGWYDARNSVANTLTQFFVAVSTDGGLTFSTNVAVRDGLSSAALSSFDYGEYAGVAFHDGIVHAVWADNSTSDDGNQDVFYASVTFSQRTLVGGAGDDTLLGSPGNDSLTGDDGADSVTAGAGHDTVLAGDDDDIVTGEDGDDSIDGGTGSDVVTGGDGDDTFVAGDGDDDLDGGSGTDQIQQTANSNQSLTDTLLSDAGTDMLTSIEEAVLSGGSSANRIDASEFTGSVTLSGGDGNDTLLGGGADDSLSGGDDDDSLMGNDGDDTIDGGSDHDIISGGNDDDSLRGGSGNDTVSGDDDDDSVSGGSGNDELAGGAGDDLLVETNVSGAVALGATTISGIGTDTHTGFESASLSAGSGNDTITASAFAGPVSLSGGSGNDSLLGGGDDDTLQGESGNDTLTGSDGSDALFGGTGSDVVAESGDVNFTLTNFTLTGLGTDLLAGDVEGARLTGGDGGNRIDASAFSGNVTLTGGAGDDTLLAGSGSSDRLVEIVTGISTLSNTLLTGNGTDAISGFEQASLTGSDDADSIDASGFSGPVTLRGADGSDALTGSSLDDSLDGGSENDTLTGGAGDDTLNGGGGDDVVSESGNSDFTLSSGQVTPDDMNFLVSDDDTDLLLSVESAIITGGGGDNEITVANFSGSVTLMGGDGDDTLTGGPSDDSLDGGDDDDVIFGKGGNDTLVGGDGDDLLDAYEAALFVTTNGNINVSDSTPATPDGINQAEVTIAVNPIAPANLIAAANTLDAAATTDTVWFSTNSGTSWTAVAIPNTTGSQDGGDPTLVFDRTGIAYYAHLNKKTTGLGISVARSTNGGASWTAVDVTTPTGTVDKEFLAVGPDRQDSSRDRLYLAYHVANVQYINSSLDGITWSNFTVVQNAVFGINAQPAVGPNGEVYLAWQEIDEATPGLGRVMFDVSVDGGLTWRGDRTAYRTSVATFNDDVATTDDQYKVPAAPDRGVGAFLAMDVDQRKDEGGTIYMVVLDQHDLDGKATTGHDDTDVFVIRSTDGGVHWSAPVRVNDDRGVNSQIVPWLDVDQETGNVAVGWYDARNDRADGSLGDTDTNGVANNEVEFFVAVSTDRGQTFLPNHRVSTGASNQSRAEPYPAGFSNFDYGEYTGVAFHDGVVYAAWADNSVSTDGKQDVFFASAELITVGGVPTVGDSMLFGDAGDDTLQGSTGDDTLTGGVDDDNLMGTLGDDELDGGDGTDRVIEFGGTNYTLTGTVAAGTLSGAGTDEFTGIEQVELETANTNSRITASGFSGSTTLIGGSGKDTLTGGMGSDQISGRGGADTIVGGGGLGTDLLTDSGDFNFVLASTYLAGNGSDSFTGIETALLIGGAGNNSLTVTTFAFPVTLQGLGGNDTLIGGAAADDLQGGDGDDVLTAKAGGDAINGGAGSDTLIESGATNYTLTNGSLAGLGADVLASIERARLTKNNTSGTIDAGTFSGNSTLLGGSGKDTITGGTGNDSINGAAGDDMLTGGAGSDTIFGLAGKDEIFGNAGDDSLDGGAGADSILAGAGDDKLLGQSDKDTLKGEAGDDTIDGGSHNDTIVGGLGDDSIAGGVGNDAVNGGAGDDTVSGGNGNDTLLGGTDNDYLLGGAGNDTLIGGGGNDTLFGQAGADRLVGIVGEDVFPVPQDSKDMLDLDGVFDLPEALLMALEVV